MDDTVDIFQLLAKSLADRLPFVRAKPDLKVNGHATRLGDHVVHRPVQGHSLSIIARGKIDYSADLSLFTVVERWVHW